ncbi:MAG TPA: alpha/beta fold hydrolase [Usitatibacter sp.]|nr:alpha/beta fold hydrolase [Usitatibacter sp.]
MATYVLVHGAWHGGWCWKRTLPGLQGPGVEIYTPTLTGLGERSHLASRDVSLETHVQDVMGVIESERLDDVVLVGHSYAGVVVTAVADRMPQRISRLVYLDAMVPKSGQSLYDTTGPAFRERIEGAVKSNGEGWYIPLPTAERMGLLLQEDIDFVMPRLVPHPARTFAEAVTLKSPWSKPVRRSYISCIGKSTPGGPRSVQAAGIDDYHELSTGHDAMVTAPAELANLLRDFGA